MEQPAACRCRRASRETRAPRPAVRRPNRRPRGRRTPAPSRGRPSSARRAAGDGPPRTPIRRCTRRSPAPRTRLRERGGIRRARGSWAWAGLKPCARWPSKPSVASGFSRTCVESRVDLGRDQNRRQLDGRPQRPCRGERLEPFLRGLDQSGGRARDDRRAREAPARRTTRSAPAPGADGAGSISARSRRWSASTMERAPPRRRRYGTSCSRAGRRGPPAREFPRTRGSRAVPRPASARRSARRPAREPRRARCARRRRVRSTASPCRRRSVLAAGSIDRCAAHSRQQSSERRP